MSLNYGITKNNFGCHLANNYPIEQIIEFMSDKTVGLNSFGGSPCEYCNEPIINDYQAENIFYHCKIGFTDFVNHNISREYEEVEFSVMYCNNCNKWFTYIE